MTLSEVNQVNFSFCSQSLSKEEESSKKIFLKPQRTLPMNV
jgi:hypothetical protein